MCPKDRWSDSVMLEKMMKTVSKQTFIEKKYQIF